MRKQGHGSLRAMCAALCSGLLCLAALAPSAGAATPPPLFAEFPQGGASGEGAGMLERPSGIAVDPVSHRIYVAETTNRRVSVFSPWGEFIFAFGWGVEDGAEELQTCTPATGCQIGLDGEGPGQFGEEPGTTLKGPSGIAVDSSGDVYVMDLGNLRVEKFDPSGNFLLTFGGEVNETTGGNVCTAVSGDACVGGEPGTGAGEFSYDSVAGITTDFLDVAPDGTVYVGSKDTGAAGAGEGIQAFDPDGIFKSSFPLPEPGNPGALVVDPTSGDLLFAFSLDPPISSDPERRMTS